MGDADHATKQDVHNLGVAMRQDMAALRIDMKTMLDEMFDDTLKVLSDMLGHIDRRFNKLEAAFEKQQKDIRRLENSRH